MPYYRVPTTNKVIQMLDKRGRLEKVIDLVSSLPISPVEGDRYIDLTDNKIKEWNGSTWDEYTPKEGDNLYVLNRDKYYYFDGSEWKDVTEISSYWEKDGDTLKPKNASNVEITASFIGDGSQLTGIKKLIEEFVAQGNVTAGDVVAFVNGQIKKGKIGNSNEIEKFGEEILFDNGTVNEVSCSALSETKIVVCYKDQSNNYYGTAIIGEIIGDVITFGSKYVFNSGNTNDISCSAIDETRFVICYRDDSNYGYGTAIVGEVVGNVITFGSKYVFNAENTSDVSCSMIGTDKFVICYADYYAVDDRRGRAIIGEVTGNVITFGSEYIFDDGSVVYISATSIGNDKFVICYRDDSNYGYGTAIVGEVVGNVITFGSKYVFNNGEVVSLSCSMLAIDKFVVCYRDDANNYYGTSIIGEVTGNVIIFGSEYVFKANSSYLFSCDRLDENKFVVCGYDYVNYYGFVIIGEVTGNVITFGSEYVFNNEKTYHISCSVLNTDKFVVCYAEGIYYNGTSIIGILQQEEYSYIGISQETKNDGETVKVLIQGLSDVHSGLTVGQKYYATPEGDLTTNETEDYLGLAVAEDKLLLMDWQRPIMLYDEDSDEYVIPE